MTGAEIFIVEGKDGYVGLRAVMGALWQCVVAPKKAVPQLQDIFAGRVVKRLGPTQALVDIGLERAGFLQAAPDEAPEGKKLVVQIVKEPFGDKGATLSLDLQLVGRYGVCQKNAKEIAFSREWNKARQAPVLAYFKDSAWRGIIRTSALHADLKTVHAEAQEQLRLMESLQAGDKPGLLQAGLNPVFAMIRDADAIGRIVCQNLAVKNWAAGYIENYQDLIPKIEVITEKILSIYDAGDQLHKAMSAKIKIANGAEILFEPGETLTAIDVDQAGADGSAFVINRSVLPEIARQISLRNVGGLIVIDFLKMTREEDRNAILEELRRSCATDSLAPRILGFTAAGLCEITRPRRGQRLSIEDILE